MTTRRSHYALALPALALLLAFSGVQPARAGMFDDEEARRQIKDLSISTNERIDTLSKAQFDLVSQIQALREESARLRGQIETLTYELDAAKKRQQDFYIDLDGRLRKLETQAAPPAAAADGSRVINSFAAQYTSGARSRKNGVLDAWARTPITENTPPPRAGGCPAALTSPGFMKCSETKFA